MPGVVVDSNILLDILSEDPNWLEWSSSQLQEVAQTSPLIINPVIFAEVAYRFSEIEDVNAALPVTMFVREPIAYEAAFLAAKAHALYRQRKGNRSTALPDFFIGAHAAVAGHSILTRDPARYRSYFPTVKLFAPE
jgi:predicted nucleic acid-binding protein